MGIQPAGGPGSFRGSAAMFATLDRFLFSRSKPSDAEQLGDGTVVFLRPLRKLRRYWFGVRYFGKVVHLRLLIGGVSFLLGI